jgi:hypothetical protein
MCEAYISSLFRVEAIKGANPDLAVFESDFSQRHPHTLATRRFPVNSAVSFDIICETSLGVTPNNEQKLR